MRTYKAAYYDNSDEGGAGVLFTDEDMAHLSDADLVLEAYKIAEKYLLVGDEPHQIPPDKFRDRLRIGDWHEGRR